MFDHLQKCILLILKVLFLMKRIRTTMFLFIILNTRFSQ